MNAYKGNSHGIHGCNEPFGAIVSDTKHHHFVHCFTAFHDDLFVSKGFYITSGDSPIVFDSGCTIAVTPHLEKFVGKMSKVKNEMTGILSTAKVEGEGNVNWTFYDDYGAIKHVTVKACYIPSITVRLFSPQHYFKQEKSGILGRIINDAYSHLRQVKH